MEVLYQLSYVGLTLRILPPPSDPDRSAGGHPAMIAGARIELEQRRAGMTNSDEHAGANLDTASRPSRGRALA